MGIFRALGVQVYLVTFKKVNRAAAYLQR